MFITQIVSKPFTACNLKITTYHSVNIVLWPATSTEKDFTLIEKREKTKRKREDKSTALLQGRGRQKSHLLFSTEMKGRLESHT
jgi:hypothetical protein